MAQEGNQFVSTDYFMLGKQIAAKYLSKTNKQNENLKRYTTQITYANIENKIMGLNNIKFNSLEALVLKNAENTREFMKSASARIVANLNGVTDKFVEFNLRLRNQMLTDTEYELHQDAINNGEMIKTMWSTSIAGQILALDIFKAQDVRAEFRSKLAIQRYEILGNLIITEISDFEEVVLERFDNLAEQTENITELMLEISDQFIQLESTYRTLMTNVTDAVNNLQTVVKEQGVDIKKQLAYIQNTRAIVAQIYTGLPAVLTAALIPGAGVGGAYLMGAAAAATEIAGEQAYDPTGSLVGRALGKVAQAAGGAVLGGLGGAAIGTAAPAGVGTFIENGLDAAGRALGGGGMVAVAQMLSGEGSTDKSKKPPAATVGPALVAPTQVAPKKQKPIKAGTPQAKWVDSHELIVKARTAAGLPAVPETVEARIKRRAAREAKAAIVQPVSVPLPPSAPALPAISEEDVAAAASEAAAKIAAATAASEAAATAGVAASANPTPTNTDNAAAAIANAAVRREEARTATVAAATVAAASPATPLTEIQRKKANLERRKEESRAKAAEERERISALKAKLGKP
jgi:hypothetical protein